MLKRGGRFRDCRDGMSRLGTYCEAVVLVYMLLEERKSTPLIKTGRGSPGWESGRSQCITRLLGRGLSSALPRHNARRCLLATVLLEEWGVHF